MLKKNTLDSGEAINQAAKLVDFFPPNAEPNHACKKILEIYLGWLV